MTFEYPIALWWSVWSLYDVSDCEVNEDEVCDVSQKVYTNSEDKLIDPCPVCDKNEAQEEHTCPAREALEDDYEFTCRCCLECTEHCAEDI